MTEYYPYTTQENERWDGIAFKAYGNAGLSKVLIEANPNVPITDILPNGTRLNIPILEEENSSINQDELPPWLRG